MKFTDISDSPKAEADINLNNNQIPNLKFQISNKF